jgi:crotonobetainyl-CoA:carnitine CoA-transferase CaiB-like acyl-CoA transferase
VLDLGVIVVGAEQSRLLADLGADVVKVETSAFPDGSRQSIDGSMSASFAAGHRNKRSVGLNLRHEVGRELFLKLAAKADVMFSNFKPGTLEALGIDRATLAKANPGIVTVESSAFGAAGPWSARLGYGPLVRAAAGLSEAWRYPTDPDSYSDSITVYPDHVAGRVGAIAALALLLRRQWLGQGGEAKISQMEVMLDQFSAEIAATGLAEPELAGPEDAPWGVYRAAGDDEWCVVTVRNDADWASLATVVGYADPHLKSRSGRLAAREQLEAVLSDWISSRSAQSAMEVLQAAGVPAARMLRASDLPDFGFFKARRFFVAMEHPKVAQDLIVERGPFCGERLGDAPQRPAPSMGEHTVEVMRDWLGADEAAIAAWVDKGALQLGAT